MKTLTIGTRIFNHGDVCNEMHLGVITKVINSEWGTDYQITPQPGCEAKEPYAISHTSFSAVYEGHAGTRFVTEEAYKQWRWERMQASR